MKRLFLCSALLFTAAIALAQKPQASPKETATAKVGDATITIVYCSPRVRGREGHIFTKDGLISHDKDYPNWRAGANAATALKTSGDIRLGDLNLPAGSYTLFVDISDPAQWTLVVSKDTGEWGLNYDKTKDLGRVKMHMTKPPALVEDMKYTIAPRGDSSGTLTLAWENKSASVLIHAR